MYECIVHCYFYIMNSYNLAYRTKSVCENPYDTSKYLVL